MCGLHGECGRRGRGWRTSATTAPSTASTARRSLRPVRQSGRLTVTSQDFEPAFDTYDNQAADDFVVPGGQTWTVEGVDVDGQYSTSGPATSFNVYFYTNGGGNLPGTLVATRAGSSYTPGPAAGDAVITLASGVTLAEGTYWVSVQADQNFTNTGQWFWSNRSVTTNTGAAWQNPGDGFGTGCTAWGRKTTCLAAPER